MEIQSQKKLTTLDLLVLFFSVYVLLALLIGTFFKVPAEISRVLSSLDNAICLFFIIEFFIRFFKAEDKLKFMKWGWIDLLSSIPNIDYLRAGRALRLIRIFKDSQSIPIYKKYCYTYISKQSTRCIYYFRYWLYC